MSSHEGDLVKGVILAGGSGTRLHPLTSSVIKQLLPVYDKPLIYYPISILMLAGIKDIQIITTPNAINDFEKLLGDGSQLGVKFEYAVQKKPNGIAEAILISKDFVGNHKMVLVLGDNIFYGGDLPSKIVKACKRDGCTIFCFPVTDAERFGVAEVDFDGGVISIEEKPSNPKSNLAITGLYCFDNNAYDMALEITPSKRGELEITDLVRSYMNRNQLTSEKLMRGNAWFDAGTFESLFEVSSFIRSVQNNTGLMVGNLEEIAFNKAWIDENQLSELANQIASNSYGQYLRNLT